MSTLLRSARQTLGEYLCGEVVTVALSAHVSIDTSLRSDGQELFFEGLPVERLKKRVSVQTRLFTPGRFFRKEEADRLLRGSGFTHADAHALASVCREAPDLQRRLGLLAFGTEIVREERTFILCAATKSFFSGSQLLPSLGSCSLSRIVKLLPTYGGFDERYAFIGMRPA